MDLLRSCSYLIILIFFIIWYITNKDQSRLNNIIMKDAYEKDKDNDS